ncbi:MAG: DJ-1/PfpI family protein [Clostridiales bacterium]|jgi:putative intracellular protease/amidase|nr:DJ-1/PfpI family protein [Clostridiales bacterium]
MQDFNVWLFDGFETLDAFGPVEMAGALDEEYLPKCYSFFGGIVKSAQHMRVDTLPHTAMDTAGILLIPGGLGTRPLLRDSAYISALSQIAKKAPYVLTVCTGSALLAATGLMDGKRATSNKLVFDWVSTLGGGVTWVRRARWVKDGKFYTSSGVSAGMDMTLGFLYDRHGKEAAEAVARYTEYIWNSDSGNDPFADHI